MYRFSTLGRLAMVPAAAIVCLATVSGCNKVTQENYAAIKPEMAEAEVLKIMGDPTSSDEQSNAFMGKASKKVWKNGDKSITVIFVDGKVFGMEKSGF